MVLSEAEQNTHQISLHIRTRFKAFIERTPPYFDDPSNITRHFNPPSCTLRGVAGTKFCKSVRYGRSPFLLIHFRRTPQSLRCTQLTSDCQVIRFHRVSTIAPPSTVIRHMLTCGKLSTYRLLRYILFLGFDPDGVQLQKFLQCPFGFVFNLDAIDLAFCRCGHLVRFSHRQIDRKSQDLSKYGSASCSSDKCSCSRCFQPFSGRVLMEHCHRSCRNCIFLEVAEWQWMPFIPFTVMVLIDPASPRMQVCHVFPYESFFCGAVKQAVHYHSFSFNAMCYCLYCLEAMVVSDCLGPLAFEFVGLSSLMLANGISSSLQFPFFQSTLCRSMSLAQAFET
ncbi:hypothetical protein T01_16279 [Trichinella spiralis]|uniref:Uncharacterized protein n=1 Tax=Trichinella spiralis TaxID=6334 RepID=A0A0V1BX38_TRISP|nr:hypothetical protein T01_16279 [Trichinella spiralis]